MDRKPAFDVVKAMACIAVVLIHYNFKGEPGDYVRTVSRFAVPVFFMISGYFLRFEKIGTNIRKLTNLLLKSTLFYAVFLFFWHCWQSHGVWMTLQKYSATYLSAEKLLRFFLTNEGLFNGMLWFIGALVCCYATVGLWFNTERRLRSLFWLIIPLLIVMGLIQEFAGLIHCKWNFVSVPGIEKYRLGLHAVFLFRALPFFLIGALIRRCERRILDCRIPSWVYLLVASLGGCIVLGELIWIHARWTQFYVGSLVTAIALMGYGIKGTSEIPILGYIGRNLSMLVYVLQYAISKVVDLSARDMHWWGKAWYDWSRWAIIMALTFLVAWVVHTVCSLSERMTRKVVER